MGTTVLSTIAYEKKMSKAIMVEPAAADSVGIKGSHGRYGRKYWPVSISQTPHAMVQNRHIDNKKKTICRSSK